MGESRGQICGWTVIVLLNCICAVFILYLSPCTVFCEEFFVEQPQGQVEGVLLPHEKSFNGMHFVVMNVTI